MIEQHDTIIIGAGPAALQLGYFMQRQGRDYLIVERNERVGSFWERLPRNRTLISFNKRHTIYKDPEIRLRWDWNSLLSDYQLPFGEFSRHLYPKAHEMQAYLDAFAERFEIPVRFGVDVRRIAKREVGFSLHTNGRDLHCTRLVVATGLSRPYVPKIEGIELVTEAYESCEFQGQAFEGQRVLILGKGNSAFELADELLGSTSLLHLASPRPIQLAWKTRHPGHVRADHARFLDSYQLKLLNSVLDCDVLRIRRSGDGFAVKVRYTHAENEVDELHYDRIVRCTGFGFDPKPFAPECKPATILDGRLPEMTPGWESKNVPGLFFAGTLMQARDFKKASSAFVDGFRYNVRTLFHLLEERYEGRSLPSREIRGGAEALTDAVLRRVCRTSGLWAQFGYLCDLVVFEPEGHFKHYEELPVDWVLEGRFADAEHFMLVTFEWGPSEGDVFALERRPRADAAHLGAFLHPVIRSYRRGHMVAEHHMLEDLYGMYSAEGETGSVHSHNGVDATEYHKQQHRAPLSAFLAAQVCTREAVVS